MTSVMHSQTSQALHFIHPKVSLSNYINTCLSTWYCTLHYTYDDLHNILSLFQIMQST